jgi:hypothetical protein
MTSDAMNLSRNAKVGMGPQYRHHGVCVVDEG